MYKLTDTLQPILQLRKLRFRKMKPFQVKGIDRCGIIERIKGFLREGNNIEARKM